MKGTMKAYLLSVLLAAFISGCSASKYREIDPGSENLGGCPDRPNCVSSEAKDTKHAVAPLRLKGEHSASWQGIQKIIGSLPRTTVVTATENYLHAECKSRVFRFVDDLELLLNPETGRIGIRSAARVGYSDMGVNRRRVETLRQQLKERGLIQ